MGGRSGATRRGIILAALKTFFGHAGYMRPISAAFGNASRQPGPTPFSGICLMCSLTPPAYGLP